MNDLLNHMTTFINTALELYSLPYEFVTDLHTLNAHLKSYSPHEEALLHGFVCRMVDKLREKMKGSSGREGKEGGLNGGSKGGVEGVKKVMDFRLNIPTQVYEMSISENRSCLQRNQSAMLSQRSGRSTKNEGIKNDRHKFGNRERNKTLRHVGSNKENVQSNANLRVEDLMKQDKAEQKSLKFIRSEAELFSNVSLYRVQSTEGRKQVPSRPKARYDSAQNRMPPHTSSLKIKLKSKPVLDLQKVRESVNELVEHIQTKQEELDGLVNNLWAQEEKGETNQ